MEKSCVACSMPMARAEDFAQSDTSKDYCCHCARADGTMKSYDEVLEGSVPWAMENFHLMGFAQRPTEPEVRKALTEHMSTLPAWKTRT